MNSNFKRLFAETWKSKQKIIEMTEKGLNSVPAWILSIITFLEGKFLEQTDLEYVMMEKGPYDGYIIVIPNVWSNENDHDR